MRLIHMTKTKRRPKAGRRDGRNSRGALAAACLTAAGLLIAYLAGAPNWLIDHEPSSRASGPSASSSQANTAARNGLIFFTSPNQDTCREHAFDNVSGIQRDKGVVDCKSALAHAKRSPVEDRMHALIDAFRSK